LALRSLLIVAAAALSVFTTACSGASSGDETGPTSSREARLVVDYQYGDAITGSEMRIFDNGVVVRTERACCPSQVEPVIAAPLTHEQIESLLADIEDASRAQVELQNKAAPSPQADEAAGELVAFNAEGQKVTIRTIEREPYRFHTNASPRSQEIVDIVNGLVRDKMPR
jgi:hypothetical protein